MSTADSPLSAIGMLFPALRIDLGGWSPWGRFVRQQARINQLIEAQIEHQKRSELMQQTLLAQLLAAQNELGQGLSDREIRDELLRVASLYWGRICQVGDEADCCYYSETDAA